MPAATSVLSCTIDGGYHAKQRVDGHRTTLPATRRTHGREVSEVRRSNRRLAGGEHGLRQRDVCRVAAQCLGGKTAITDVQGHDAPASPSASACVPTTPIRTRAESVRGCECAWAETRFAGAANPLAARARRGDNRPRGTGSTLVSTAPATRLEQASDLLERSRQLDALEAALGRGPQHVARRAWCSSPVRPGPARRRWRAASPTGTGSRRGSCGARATRCSRRARWVRCSTSPSRPAATSRRSPRAGRTRTRWRSRCCASSRAGRRPCSSSRTCTGPTRPPSTSCGCSPARWTRRPRWSSRTYRDDELDAAPSAAGRARRAGHGAGDRALRAAAAVARRRRAARRAARHRRGRAVPPDGGQPVLPLRGPGRRRRRHPADRPRRRPGPHGAPERDGGGAAGRRLRVPAARRAVAARRAGRRGELACLDECLGSGMLAPTPTASPSATSWPGWRSRRRSRRTAGRRCTATRWRRSPRRRPARPSPRGSPTTPRPPATRTPCCGSPRPPPRARRGRRPPPGGRAVRARAALRRPICRARERVALLEGRFRSAFRADDCDEAIEAMQEALQCHRALGDRLREGDRMRRLSGVLFCPGDRSRRGRAPRPARP